jgi:hypothetical protein
LKYRLTTTNNSFNSLLDNVSLEASQNFYGETNNTNSNNINNNNQSGEDVKLKFNDYNEEEKEEQDDNLNQQQQQKQEPVHAMFSSRTYVKVNI